MFFRKNENKARYRVRIDGWLYLSAINLVYNLDSAFEFDTLKDAYKAAVEIPHADVVIIENKNGRVTYTHIEELLSKVW